MTNRTYVWGFLNSHHNPHVVVLLDPRLVRVSEGSRYDPMMKTWIMHPRVDITAKPQKQKTYEVLPAGKTVWTWTRDKGQSYGLSMVLDAMSEELAVAKWRSMRDRIIANNMVRKLILNRSWQPFETADTGVQSG